jgi:hypothetical protein
VLGTSLKRFAGSLLRTRTQNAARGIGIAGFGAWGLLRAL